jgi:hypothetical protein
MTDAAKNGVSALYRFTPYPPDGKSPTHHQKQRRRVEALIIDGELYFPTAAQLNDPFEARPNFSPLHADAELTTAALVQALRQRFAPAMGLSDEQVRGMEARIAEADPQARLRSTRSEMAPEIPHGVSALLFRQQPRTHIDVVILRGRSLRCRYPL